MLIAFGPLSFLKSLVVAGTILWDKAAQLYHLFNF
jgi:hypothetical protein